MRRLILLFLSSICVAQGPTLPFGFIPQVASGSIGTITYYDNTSCGSVASCNVSTVTLASGDDAVVYVADNGSGAPLTITSVTGQPKCLVRFPLWTPAYPTGGNSNACWIHNATAVSASTVTVNFSKTSSSPTGVTIVRIAHTGTLAIDTLSNYIYCVSGGCGVSSLTEPTLNTVSGTNAIILAELGYNNGSATIGGSYSSPHCNSNGGNDFCISYLKNVSSYTNPAWSGSGMCCVSGLVLSFNPTTPSPVSYVDGSGSTTGTTISAANLGASTFGAANFSTQLQANDTQFVVLSSHMQYETTVTGCAPLSIQNSAPRFAYGGNTYPNSGQLAMVYNEGVANSGVKYVFSSGGGSSYGTLVDPVVSMWTNFCLDNPQNDTTGLTMDFWKADTNDASAFVTLGTNTTGSAINFSTEAGAGIVAQSFPTTNIASNTTYKLWTQMNGGMPPLTCNVSNVCTNGGSNGAVMVATTPITLTVTPCPFAGTYTSQPSSAWGTQYTPYYITGGTGATEFVVPTATTCATNSASGTVTFTPANSHTGAFTVGSANQVWIMNSTGTSLIQSWYTTTLGGIPIWVQWGNEAGASTGSSGHHLVFSQTGACWSSYSVLGTACPGPVIE